MGALGLALAAAALVALAVARTGAPPPGAVAVPGDRTPVDVETTTGRDLVLWDTDGGRPPACAVVDVVTGEPVAQRSPQRRHVFGSGADRTVAVASVRTSAPLVVVTCAAGGEGTTVVAAPEPTAPVWLAWWGPFVGFPAVLAVAGLVAVGFGVARLRHHADRADHAAR